MPKRYQGLATAQRQLRLMRLNLSFQPYLPTPLGIADASGNAKGNVVLAPMKMLLKTMLAKSYEEKVHEVAILHSTTFDSHRKCVRTRRCERAENCRSVPDQMLK